MNFDVQQIEYINVAVDYGVSDASRLLSTLASNGIDFLAYKAVSMEREQTLFTLFSDDAKKLAKIADRSGFKVDGPRSAILVRGDEEIGALAEIYQRLSRANISVDESSGIAHINGGYGVVLYVKQEECERAVIALQKSS